VTPETPDYELPDYLIRVAASADIPAIQATAAAAWRATYGSYMEAAFINNFLARAYRVEALTAEIAAGQCCFLVAQAADELIGFGQVGPSMARRAPAPVAPADLVRLYLLPAWQGRGVGTALLRRLEAWLRAVGYPRYGAYVHVRNIPAQRFYLRQGFVHLPAADIQDEWYLIKTLT
jgi:GNAT superfamily N-acetyltransferase